MRVGGELLCQRVVVSGEEQTASHPLHQVAEHLSYKAQVLSDNVDSCILRDVKTGERVSSLVVRLRYQNFHFSSDKEHGM